MNLIILLGLITLSAGIRIKSKTNPLTLQNTELFKYSANDEYTLSEDVDETDDNKPPVNFQGDVKGARTLAMENRNQGKGKFKYSLETANGIELQQVGKLKDEKTFVVSGSYKYTGADGKKYRVRYTADELGYHPITELDIEIPDIVIDELGNKGFQFLNQNLNDRGHGQIGDDFSYNKKNEYPYPARTTGNTFNTNSQRNTQTTGNTYSNQRNSQSTGTFNIPHKTQTVTNTYNSQHNSNTGGNDYYHDSRLSGYDYEAPSGSSQLYLPPYRPDERPSNTFVPGY